MPQITFGTVLRILVASLIVGAVMAWFDITPSWVLGTVTGLAKDAIDNAQAWLGSAISYVLLGAVIVVPIWLLSYLLKFLRR